MTKWEYNFVDNIDQEKCAALGLLGWELCSIITGTYRLQSVFKRAIDDPVRNIWRDRFCAHGYNVGIDPNYCPHCMAVKKKVDQILEVGQ